VGEEVPETGSRSWKTQTLFSFPPTYPINISEQDAYGSGWLNGSVEKARSTVRRCLFTKQFHSMWLREFDIKDFIASGIHSENPEHIREATSPNLEDS
jgi:hypothetical protein